MSDPVLPLDGAAYDGFARVREAGPLGMLSLRADLAVDWCAEALASAGFTVPKPLKMAWQGAYGTGWMAPDEALLIVPLAEVAQVRARLGQALAARHHLLAEVSNARAVFRIEGAGGRDVLAKLCPINLSPAVFGPGELRRTRAAQVAVAVWLDPDGAGLTLVAYRSVARYVFDLLALAARPGSEPALYVPCPIDEALVKP